MKTNSKIKIIETEIPAVKKIITTRFGDTRGYFEETYNRNDFAKGEITLNFVQDNQSRSQHKGTVRGLHYQLPPFAQDKLLRVLKGALLDVAVDVRKGSPTFGKHVKVVLTAKEPEQLLIPVGFAHGFCTLEPDTEVLYKVTNFWSGKDERGLLWNDPALKIEWPVEESKAVVSDKDKTWPTFAKQTDFFT
jgi:dTDP-4-dehydrorhamnose 3,5-epimerase